MKGSNEKGWVFTRLRIIWALVRKGFVNFAEGFWWPPLTLLAVAVYWFSVAGRMPLPSEKTVEKYGVYGDSFGQLTSLFTALGFGGLIITLLLQQRQIRNHEEAEKHNRQKDEKSRYEEVLFTLLDIYRQTLSEVRIGKTEGRDVLERALNRVDAALINEGVNGLPSNLLAKFHKGSLSDSDRERIDYYHYRNFKIVAAEIHQQTRLVDTFEVLLEHMVKGAPDHMLINSYRELIFAQITFIESRYFFLVALSYSSRGRLRDLIARSGFIDRVSRSQNNSIHREMYKEYWGQEIKGRSMPVNVPMTPSRIKRALKANKAAGGISKTIYTPSGVKKDSSSEGIKAENNQL